MAILTKAGRAAIAQSIGQRPIHLAWGAGDETSKDKPDSAATALKNEVGRRVANEVLFCIGDPEGDLIAPTGRFKRSDTPTNNLFMRFTFDFEDASTKTIQELGVMIGTQTNPELPPGQRYFELKDIVEPGILLLLEYIPPLIRTPSSRETFTFVVTF